MQALDYWKAVTADRSGFLERLVGILRNSRVKYCVIGDPERRPSKRQKDLADISRLLEARPDLRKLVPPDVLARLL